ncbi:MAG: CYTH domain-containing protein [Oscillospiraceae bacterium]|nr:CYTH domain-containing protein [Oscillospiraceae bacterium]
MGTEYELKYRANADAVSAIQKAYHGFASIQMETTYYDTFDGKLFNRRWTLRQRMENGTSVCTLKIPLEDGSRGEWEVHSPNLIAGIPELCKAGAPLDLMVLTVNGIVPVCGARFLRLVKTIALKDCIVELSLDQGFLIGRGKELPLCEVEVELKEGNRNTADHFAAQLAQDFGLIPEADSKYRRALILAYS